jgi:hypothetical protein
MVLISRVGEHCMIRQVITELSVFFVSYFFFDNAMFAWLQISTFVDATSIGTGFLIDCTSLTSVIIPDTINTIRNRFLTRCTSLTSVIVPDSVIIIKKQNKTL